MGTSNENSATEHHIIEPEDRPRRYRIVGGPTGLGVEVLALRYTGTAATLRALGGLIGVHLRVDESTAVFTHSPLGSRQVQVGVWAEIPVRGPVSVRWIGPERFAEWYAQVEDDQTAALVPGT